MNHLKNFSFDGVIFAVFGAEKYVSMDLCRPLAVKHTWKDQTYFTFWDSDTKLRTKYVRRQFGAGAYIPILLCQGM
jgi:hypothetical protein